MNRITILGCGTSTGVPILGCKCQVCQSKDPRNHRLRASVLLETSSAKRILVDATPDLRTQLLRAKIDLVDAVIITHDHADHTHGMDDLRPFSFLSGQDLPVLCTAQTASGLRVKFPYIFDRENHFKEKAVLGGGIPLLKLTELTSTQGQLAGENFHFHPLPHGHVETLGILHGKMAYLTDCRSIPPETLTALREAQLDLLIIDCLRFEPHQTHLHLDLTLEYIDLIRPKKSVLTHMGHELEYSQLLNQLHCRGARNVFPASDGMSFLYSST